MSLDSDLKDTKLVQPGYVVDFVPASIVLNSGEVFPRRKIVRFRKAEQTLLDKQSRCMRNMCETGDFLTPAAATQCFGF